MSSRTAADATKVLEAVERPITQARGLPADWYTDPGHFTREEDRLFRRGWLAVCFSQEVADPGDVLPQLICGSRIVLVRGDDGTLRAFHNVCRHRASLVVQAPAKNCRLLKCPYHCWSYGLDGKLRHAPFFDGTSVCNMGGEEIALMPVRCEEREGIVFINLDGTAEDIDSFLEPMTTRWQAFDRSRLDRFTMLENTIPVNWKIVMEGLLEVYHEKFVHAALGYRLDKNGRKTFEDLIAGELMGFRAVMPEDKPDHPEMTLPRLPGMPQSGPAPTEIFLMFPNLSCNILDNHLVRTIWTYPSHRETRWKSTWYFAPGVTESDSGRAMCRDVVTFWEQVRKEDLGAVLAVQAGIESRTPQPIETRYSPFWEPILQHFHSRVARGLADMSTDD